MIKSPAIQNKGVVLDKHVWVFYQAIGKDIRWCQKSSFGGWNILPTRNNENNNFINFLSDKCAKKLVWNVGEEATTFCVSCHLAIFPDWKLGPINLAIYSVLKYSKVISEECLQTLSHDNVLKDTRISLYNWNNYSSTESCQSLSHDSLYKVSPLGFYVCGPIDQ